MADVQPGDVFVPGSNADTARELLAAARGAGLPTTVVKTTAGGFIVPERIAPKPKTGPKKSSAPRTRRKKTAK